MESGRPDRMESGNSQTPFCLVLIPDSILSGLSGLDPRMESGIKTRQNGV